jgi:transcriptional regulator with XRE-family HTH domain
MAECFVDEKWVWLLNTRRYGSIQQDEMLTVSMQTVQTQTRQDLNTCVMVKDLSKRALKVLGRRIRDLRLAQGFSQEEFADKCGVHRTFMGTIERGESNLSFSNILKVATTLGISLAALLEGVDRNVEPGGRESATGDDDLPLTAARRSAKREPQ